MILWFTTGNNPAPQRFPAAVCSSKQKADIIGKKIEQLHIEF
jgi:hypothetical protein